MAESSGPKSNAPWVNDYSAWGRIRLTKRMWLAAYRAVDAYLRAKWKVHHELPNPSPEGRKSIDEIRELQKVLENLRGLGEEKGWAYPTPHDGSSETESVEPLSSTTSTTTS